MRGRAGFAVSNFLIYGTAGVAFGELQGETVGLQSESHELVVGGVELDLVDAVAETVVRQEGGDDSIGLDAPVLRLG